MLAAPKHERDAAFAESFFLFNVILFGGALGLSLFIQPALAILTPEAYHAAASVVPIILMAYVVQSWMDAVKFGIDARGRTRYHAQATWASVVVTLGLYWALIPRFGMYGAASATLVGFFVRFCLTFYWSQRLLPIAYGWRRVSGLLSLSMALAALYWFVGPTGVGEQIAVASTLWIAFLGLTWLLLTTQRERRVLSAVFFSPSRTFALLVRGEHT